MPSVAKKLGKMAASTLLYLIAFDVVGVVVCFFFDIAPLRGKSTALFYAIWFVLGVFCGLLSYNTAGSIASPQSNVEWTNREDSGKSGLLAVLTISVVLTALSVAFYLLLWRYQPEASFFVPDTPSPTLTFFVTILASVVFAHKSLRSAPKKSV
jgi:hypothetical protein